MTTLYDPAAGDNPTAAQLRTYKPLYARKTADTSVTTTTLAADGTLVIPSLSISVEYEVHLHLLAKAGNASNGGLKFDFTVPTGADITNFAFSSSSPATSGPTGASGAVSGLTLATTNSYTIVRGTLIMSTTSGSLTFRWAQNSASGNTTIVSAGSFLKLRQVT